MNLWHTAHKERQLDNNIHLYIYKESIREIIQRNPLIPPKVVEAYSLATRFKAGHHHMYIQAKKDPSQEWFPTRYQVTKEEMGHIMEDWDDYWKIPQHKKMKVVREPTIQASLNMTWKNLHTKLRNQQMNLLST